MTPTELLQIKRKNVDDFLCKAQNYIQGAGASRVPFDAKTGNLVLGWLKAFNHHLIAPEPGQ